MSRDLSILIPARNEEFLKKTVEDILANIEGDTEIIAVLDGYETDLPTDPRLRVIYNPESIGQRAGTNQACKLSKAKYVMKCDAHCAFDKGFDRKMVEAFKETGDNVTMVPTMRNLHAFDWVCPDGHRRYQSPSGVCKDCGKPTVKDVVWIPKKRPESNSYCFDSEPHFQYFNEYTKRPGYGGDLTETMSIQGSCFMMTRDKYWEMDVCDETFGSWGSQGIEVACKTWLSGGRVLVNHKTWYAHMFRTQGGDFGFPYPISGKQTDRAKALSKKIWFDNLWPKQIYPLSWLLQKFWPVKGWSEEDFAKIKAWPLPNQKEIQAQSAGIVYYTDNRIDEKIMEKCQKQIEKSELPIVSVSLQPLNFGDNIVLPLERGYLTMFKQILAGLEKIQTDIVFFCEHDVLYHESHFKFTPPTKDKFYYNQNVWRLRSTDGFAVHYDCNQLSGLCCYRELAIPYYKDLIARIEKDGWSLKEMSFEPGTRDNRWEAWKSEQPNVDIRHGANLTKSKWSPADFRNPQFCVNWQTSDEIPFWGKLKFDLK